jgi:dipicolinate synthase subunit A
VNAFHFGGRKIVLVGGDRRHDYLGRRLAALGAQVWLVRRRAPRRPGLTHTNDLPDALAGASVLICPMPPFGALGRVWSEDPEDVLTMSGREFGLLARPSLVFAGSFPSALLLEARRAGCEAIALGDLDEVAILNSIPTAEGALLLALERTTVTLHGSPSLVLGYGRTGQTLGQVLAALGSVVTVVARRPESRARAIAGGCRTCDFSDLAEAAEGCRFVFNTVPAMVLVGDVLSRLHPDAVVVDLASGQGGTDFSAAGTLGIAAVLAPSLPGRVAPETAAAYLSDIIARLAAERFGGDLGEEGQQ